MNKKRFIFPLSYSYTPKGEIEKQINHVSKQVHYIDDLVIKTFHISSLMLSYFKHCLCIKIIKCHSYSRNLSFSYLLALLSIIQSHIISYSKICLCINVINYYSISYTTNLLLLEGNRSSLSLKYIKC